MQTAYRADVFRNTSNHQLSGDKVPSLALSPAFHIHTPRDLSMSEHCAVISRNHKLGWLEVRLSTSLGTILLVEVAILQSCKQSWSNTLFGLAFGDFREILKKNSK